MVIAAQIAAGRGNGAARLLPPLLELVRFQRLLPHEQPGQDEQQLARPHAELPHEEGGCEEGAAGAQGATARWGIAPASTAPRR